MLVSFLISRDAAKKFKLIQKGKKRKRKSEVLARPKFKIIFTKEVYAKNKKL